VLWEEARWRGFPGYGWVFPGPGMQANLGVGVGVLGDRAAAGHAARSLGAFVGVLNRFGLLDHHARLPAERLGGWLKMGMVGTTPARGRVLLAGDAAGLVNPLQGEGISEALASGRAAAEAVLACPSEPSDHYRSFLAERYAGFHASNAAVQAALVRRARVVAAAGRVLTAPVVGRALAGGWAVYWNELLDGAMPGGARNTAVLATAIARAATSASSARRSVMNAVDRGT
jgi:menaquinone-9 beta-reductase